MEAYTGFLGILFIFGIGYLMSENRKAISWRAVLGAFAIQVAFALFVLYIPVGREMLGNAAAGFSKVIDSGKEGVAFVFGSLASGKGFIFAVHALAVIIFIASLFSVLYYIKLMPLIVNVLGGLLKKLLGTSRSESISATANIFLGQTEAPLAIKPFLPHMTRSQIFAVMVGGLASVSGGMLVGYAALGVDLKYLIAAAFMAAPAGLLMAKLIVPETEEYDEIAIEEAEEKEDGPRNIIEAAADGATAGLQLVLNVGAMLIAFIGIISLCDMILGMVGNMVNMPQLSFKYILSLVFQPISFLLGVAPQDQGIVGGLLGEKIILNEFVAFTSFAAVAEKLAPHTRVIVTFALCGFANIGSIGVLIGGLGSLAPNQKSRISEMAVKAIAAGTMANLLSATLAGIITQIAG